MEIAASTLGIERRAQLGRQPLEAVALPGGRVVARDWKTGEALQGSLGRAGLPGE